MRTSTTRVNDRIADAYENARGFIAEQLRENGLSHVRPDYSFTQDRCFNVNRHHGSADLVVEVGLDYSSNDYLTLIGQSGTEYPVGESVDGQDDYLVFNLDTLVLACDKAVKETVRDCIHLPTPRSIDNLRNAILDKLGERDGNYSFSGETEERPLHGGYLKEIKDYVAVIQGGEDAGPGQNPVPVEFLSLKDCFALINYINDDIKDAHNRRITKPEEQ